MFKMLLLMLPYQFHEYCGKFEEEPFLHNHILYSSRNRIGAMLNGILYFLVLSLTFSFAILGT